MEGSSSADMARSLLRSDALATVADATGTKAALKALGQSGLTNGASKPSLFKHLDKKLTWKMFMKVYVCLLVVGVAAAGGYCMCRAWVEGLNPFTITIKKPRLWVPATGVEYLYIASETTYVDWYPDACDNDECYSGTLTFHTTTDYMVTSRPYKGELIRVDIPSRIVGAAVFKVSPEMSTFSTVENPVMPGNFLLTLTATENRPANIPYTPKQDIDMNEAWKTTSHHHPGATPKQV